MLSKQDLLNQLNKFSCNGKPVIVHSSLKAIGEIDGGADTLIDALKEVFL